MQRKKRNYYVELLRFIFCILILLHHSGLVSDDGSGLVPSAGVIADAFFIITGYFACRHIALMEKTPDKALKYSLTYTVKKLVKVLPYSVFGIVIIYFLELLHLGQASLREHITRLYTMFVEMLLLPMLGIMEVNLINLRNAPLWYLSAILIALPVVLLLAIKCNKLFRYVIVWICPLLLEFWMVNTYGGALPWMNRSPIFIYTGAIRGFSSILLGCSVFYASEYLALKCADNVTWKKVLFSIMEITIFVYVLYNIIRGINGYMEVITIYLLALMLIFVFSGVTYTSGLQIEFFGRLGSISLPVYCMHWGVYRWVGTYLGMLPYVAKILLTFVLCLLASIVLMKIIGLFTKKDA